MAISSIKKHHFKKSPIYSLLFCLFVSFLANMNLVTNAIADLVQKDLFSNGDKLLIWDTETNLEWLSLDATVDRSADSLLEGTGGPDYLGEYGFHSATPAELTQFWGNAGVPASTGGSSTTYTTAISDLMYILGWL